VIFDRSYPGSPILVKNLDVGDEKHDFYIIPYNTEPTGFIKKGSHGQSDKDKTLVAIIVNADTGQFQEASWVDDPVKYLKTSESDARLIVHDALVDLGINLDELLVRSMKTDLIHRGGYSQFSPEWRIIIDELGLTFFINQDGAVKY